MLCVVRLRWNCSCMRYEHLSVCTVCSGYEALRMSEMEIRAHLGNFGLSGDIVLKPIGSLSGGQKTRQVSAVVYMVRGKNVE